jgi:hypothetical protein
VPRKRFEQNWNAISSNQTTRGSGLYGLDDYRTLLRTLQGKHENRGVSGRISLVVSICSQVPLALKAVAFTKTSIICPENWLKPNVKNINEFVNFIR